jgi:hypothetical protein
MYISNQQVRVVHQQMLREAMEHNALRPRRSPKRRQEKRQRRLMRVPALLLVKLGRTLEGFGQAYLEERQQRSV